MIPIHLKKIIDILPDLPGVYKYKDNLDVIIYVGKAKNLKKRVTSYFNKQQYENKKTAVLVKNIYTIDFTVVDTEMDALLLENNLIKEHQPKYNINLKDDKSYPFIRITKDRFPKVFAMRNQIHDGSTYFGPYTSVPILRNILELIKQLYPIRNCNLALTQKNIEANKFKVCLEFHLGNCKGPCEGLQSETDYIENIKHIKHILNGNLTDVKKHIKDNMLLAASLMEFEKAQRFKTQLQKLENYQHKSTIVNKIFNPLEVYAISSTEKIAFIHYLRIQEGLIVTSRNLEIKKRLNESNEELLIYAIAELHNPICNEILISEPITLEIPKVKISNSTNGERTKLLQLSLKNAMFFRNEKLNQYEKLNPQLKVDRVMQTMKKDLRLKSEPTHIECFDNSNFHGSNPVSACVVFKNGKPSKTDYRIFNVKTVVGSNDFATMQEVIKRRYTRLIAENLELPQLIIVDGGKGQLSATVEILKELNLYGKLAVIGIAKRLEEIYYPEDSVPIYIDKKSETLKIIQQLRDEAHRFGITNHRNRRSKSTFVTELTQIIGIGPNTATELLAHFKSIDKIKNAPETEIVKLIGTSKASALKSYFNT